jgi:hypothetical protein
VLRKEYDMMTVGYSEERKIYKVLRQGFYWLEIKREIERYV